MNSEGKNKETMNKHAYLLSSVNARRTQNNGSKSMAANEKQIYPLCLPTKVRAKADNAHLSYRKPKQDFNELCFLAHTG
ncbi:hypothetical protein T06_2070 [Trichinella sp. T6]|nr:hypothetical protein T06_2070 [Trichinella sp. T6]